MTLLVYHKLLNCNTGNSQYLRLLIFHKPLYLRYVSILGSVVVRAHVYNTNFDISESRYIR